MGFRFNPYAVPGTLALILGWTMAIYVFVSGPGRVQNKRLALLLAIEACIMGSGAGVMYFMTEAADAQGIQGIFVSAMLASPVAYLLFISTLDAPLARLLRPRAVQASIIVAGLAAQAYWLTHRADFTPAMVPVWYAPWEAIIGEPFLVGWAAVGIVSLFALVVTVNAYATAPPGSPARERAKYYVIAFSVRDFFYVLLAFGLVNWIPPPPTGTWTDMIYIWGFPAALTWFVVILTYGFVKVQLFDIDLKIKRNLARGVVAAVFLAVFFAVAQVAQNWVADEYGWVVGGMATGLLVFAIRPLENMATRATDVAMPKVRDTGEYVTFRKFQVYRAALEGAFEDGAVTPKERAVLERLRAELGISSDDARSMEDDLRVAAG